MAIDPKKALVARIVCEQFLIRKGTTRHSLIREIKDGFLIDEMQGQSLIRETQNTNLYFPTLGTFALLPDEDPRLSNAKLGTLQVLHTLRNLYDVEGPSHTYLLAQLLAAVQKRYDAFDKGTASLGLYLVPFNGLMAVQSYSWSDDQLELKSLVISERVMVIEDPEPTWQRCVEICRHNAQLPDLAPPTPQPRPQEAAMATNQPTPKQKPWLPKGWTGGRLIAEGGQGRTYKVRRASDEDDRWFVFKRIKNPDRADRFHSEIKALRTLDHPGILRIIENDTHEGNPYYIAEYCENGDLSNLNLLGLTTLGRLELFRQICGGVAAAHAAKIVHRDIKPSNVLVRSDGSVAVGDFGLCIHLDAEDRLTATDEAVGPRNFMAPELEDGRTDVTPAADVYSLGKLLYFLISGRSFSREKHHEPQYDLTRPGTGLPEPGVQFAYELLDKSIVENPELRFKDAGALVESLDGVILRIALNAHVLDRNAKQRCLYCVDGEYQAMGQPDENRLSYICRRCGNVQHFSSTRVGSLPWWMAK
jgi:hypothetical protein